MRRRIFASIMLVVTMSVVLASVLLCWVFYQQYTDAIRADLRQRAEAFLGKTVTQIEMLRLPMTGQDVRYTLIDAEGVVRYDTAVAAAGLPNHLDRQEVRQALAMSVGESRRHSDALGQETYYCAVRLADGAVLRLARTTSSVLGTVAKGVPVVIGVVLLMLLLGYGAAGRLTKRIIAPINGVDLQKGMTVPYDELAPFARTIGTQQQRIEEQLSDLQHRSDTIDAIMDNVREGIVLVNSQGIILSANRSILRVLGIAEDKAGRNVLELLRDVDLLACVRGALAGQGGEMTMAQGAGEYRVYCSPVTDRGAMILFVDMTEKGKAEKLRREFSANVSHELKTPLTSIYGLAEMLAGGMVKEEDKETFYCRMKEEAARVIALIEDIIMISRLDEGEGRNAFEQVNLAQVAAEAAQALADKAVQSGVQVRLECEEVTLCANRAQMYELFANLLDNAIKYNRPAGDVLVTVGQADGRITIEVADTGIGIPLSEQPRVFERFYRVDKSRSKKTGGTGLGLAIVKHIVLVHGGRVALESRPEEGTKIAVTLHTAPHMI